MRRNFNKNRRPQRPKKKFYPKDVGLKVTVRDGNVDENLRILKKKVKKANLIQEIKDREFYQTRNQKRRIAKQKAIRRAKKNQRERTRSNLFLLQRANYRRQANWL